MCDKGWVGWYLIWGRGNKIYNLSRLLQKVNQSILPLSGFNNIQFAISLTCGLGDMTQNVQRSGTRIFSVLQSKLFILTQLPGQYFTAIRTCFTFTLKILKAFYQIKKTSCSSLLTKFITELIEDTAILTEFSIQLDR